MSRGSSGSSLNVTLIAPGPAEEAQSTWWRPLSWKWPAFSKPPGLQVIEWERALDPEESITGDAVLIITPDLSDARLFALLDRLDQDALPALVLHPAVPGDLDPIEGVITMPQDADPLMITSALAALAQRQGVIDSLRADVAISRRFHGGIRGEIEKIHDELQLAATVQREFLPQELPASSGLDVRVLFRPCGYVSGDIYDVQQLDRDHVAFFVADAVGHGVPAALMTMVLCRCLVTTERDGDRTRIIPPARALRRLNMDLIRRHGEGSRFATAIYGVIDTRTRHVTLAGAGHPYPLRIRGDRVERAETEGGLLGLDANDEFSETSFRLEADELLVVYTDGFETAFPAPNVDEYGRRIPNRNYVDRFIDLTREWRRRGMSSAVEALLGQIDLQAGSLHQADDLTALILAPASEDPLEALMQGRESADAPHEPEHSIEAGSHEDRGHPGF
ncbi:MAG: serine/threonine-protein phosphatase [Phycisphaerae bacterium]|nr:serine/threonine-protein phosphatase [Phycisphaerae bacterium]